MTTFASLFTGGNGAGLGAKQAGLTDLWGVEHDDALANGARANGFDVLTADVCDVDYSSLQSPFWLHMSPPCTRASKANPLATESDLDQHLADACIRAMTILQPPYISLENVREYQSFASYRRILVALTANGYCYTAMILNAADYGVPQTRIRLFVVASRTKMPQTPIATHYDARNKPINMFAQAWRGWYDAIVDLLPSLPDSHFARWQLERMPAELRAMVLGQSLKTFVVSGSNAATKSQLTIRYDDQPISTITSSMGTKGTIPRIFLIGGGNTNTHEERDRRPRYGDEPIFTIATNARRNTTLYDHGIVKKLNARAIARLCSFPDAYQLPQREALAVKILGNAVMPPVMRAIIEANL